jgi:hypothetical protein
MSEDANTSSEHNQIQPEAASAAAAGAKQPEEESRRRGAAFWWWTGGGVALIAAAILAGLFWGGVLGKKRFQKQAVQNAYVFPVDGVDSHGRKAAFDFIVLTSELTWVKGSSDHVEHRGEVVPDLETASRVINADIARILQRSKDLIAIGLASSEGGRPQEEERAERRAVSIAGWLGGAGDAATPVWRLNLGQYDRACKSQEDADTSFERPLLFAGVRDKEEGVNLQEALADAVSGKENLPSRSCYSRFDLARNR